MENNEVKENQEVNNGEETPENQKQNSNENKEVQENQNTNENFDTNEDQEGNENKQGNEEQQCSENKVENQGSFNKEKKEGEKGSNYSMNLAIIGGVVGAGIGLLANPETSKKVIKNLGESELVKTAGNEFKKTAQELLAGQAQSSVKQIASGYISKFEEGLLNSKKSNSGSDKEGRYEEVKQENKQLNERLDKIEQMLGNLVESK